MPVEPFVDHGMSRRFRLRAIAAYDSSSHFNGPRLNGYDPLISFDPSADGISNAPVFHGSAAPAIGIAIAVRLDVGSPTNPTMSSERPQRLKRCRAISQE